VVRIKRSFVILILLFVVLLSTVAVAASAVSGSSLSVTGTASLTVKPDTAEIVLGSDTEGATAKAAQESNSAIMDRVLRAVTSQGIDKASIKTVRFGVSPNYRYDNNSGKSTIDGYRSEHRISITVTELSSVGKILDSAVDAGASSIDSVSFILKDTSNVKLEALSAAASDARRKADALALSLGVKIIGIAAVVEEDTSVAQNPRPFSGTMVRDLSMKNAAAVNVEEGEVNVTTRLHVDYLIQ
jgi:uncharacterized protein YggE